MARIIEVGSTCTECKRGALYCRCERPKVRARTLRDEDGWDRHVHWKLDMDLPCDYCEHDHAEGTNCQWCGCYRRIPTQNICISCGHTHSKHGICQDMVCQCYERGDYDG